LQPQKAGIHHKGTKDTKERSLGMVVFFFVSFVPLW
jgi:hypothetical protein